MTTNFCDSDNCNTESSLPNEPNNELTPVVNSCYSELLSTSVQNKMNCLPPFNQYCAVNIIKIINKFSSSLLELFLSFYKMLNCMEF